MINDVSTPTRRARRVRLADRIVRSVVLVFLCGAVVSSMAAPAGIAGARTIDAESPRSAVRGYLEACRAGDYRRAASHLDLSESDRSQLDGDGPVLARHLKVVLDRSLWIELESLSDEAEGLADDRLPSGVDRLGTVRTSRGEVDVLVHRVSGADGEKVWLISPSTVERIPSLYAEFGYGALGEFLPEEFFVVRFLEVELWQWIGIALMVVLACSAGYLATRILYRAARPLVSRTESDLDDRLLGLTAPPVRWLAALLFFAVGVLPLGLAIPAQRLLGRLEVGATLILVGWLVLRVVDVAFDALQARLERQERRALVAILPLGRKTAKAVVIVLAVIVMLQQAGLNVTGLIAGLGVGGLAVALAAQRTLENLFGGVTLTADQPVRVGDFCKFGDRVGTIEDVGLRSTRIRTLDRTLVTVPNAQFSQIEIENFASRDRIRLHFVLGLRYETTPDQLRHVLTELRKLLIAHPKIHPDPARVRFTSFGAYALDVEVFAYVTTTDWNEFLAVREDVYLRMMDIVEDSGTGFAFPSQTLYLRRDGGLDDQRSRGAERTVREWREAGTLPFPDFPPRAKAEMLHSLDYPPRGSAATTTVP